MEIAVGQIGTEGSYAVKAEAGKFKAELNYQGAQGAGKAELSVDVEAFVEKGANFLKGLVKIPGDWDDVVIDMAKAKILEKLKAL